MDQDLISQFEQNPTLGLKLIIDNNAKAVRAKLSSMGIATKATNESIYSAVAGLLNSGDKQAALNALTVPVIAEKLPEGYTSELQDAGLLTPEYDMSYIPFGDVVTDPTGDESGNFGAGDNGSGAGGNGSGNNFQWGDFFDFASQIVVGLWGTPQYGQNPYAGQQMQRNNTVLYVVIAALVIIVLAVLFISVKNK